MTPAVVFAVALGAYLAGHQVADHWLQAEGWALGKGAAGWPGRRACAAHVAVYTVALAAFLALAAWWLTVPVSPGRAATGLAVSAVTHYYADRRVPLQRLARAAGKGTWWDKGGSYVLDQSWHWGWLFAAALLTAK
jgi:hypothetical protein